MRIVTIDLDQLSNQALFEIAETCTETAVLTEIFKIGVERNDDRFFLCLAKNQSPEIQEILETVCQTEAASKCITREEFATNPYTPGWVLEKCLKTSVISPALYNKSTPAAALNNCFPEILQYESSICKSLVDANGIKLSNEVLRMIVEKYDHLEEPKKILENRVA